ncbi:MAG: ribonuclease HI family protein [Halobacteria archaeon]|nr:ribonuclease HI family protein [Halobacteria archaeon]
MGHILEIPPGEVRETMEEMGADFTDAKEDELWRARHGGSVVAAHENGVVVYGDVSLLGVLEDEGETGGKGVVHFDGASKGNPGPSSAAYVVSRAEDSTVLTENGERIGKATNNEAEYTALLMGLREAKRRGFDEVEAVGDSQLIVKQVRGDWNCNSENLKPLYDEVRELADSFDSFEIRHVPRETNERADRIANEVFET